MSDLRTYVEMVKRLASQRKGEPFYNGSPDHAAAIVAELFSTAKSAVALLSDDLDARVYGRSEVVQEARLFLKQSNHKLRVLIEHETLEAEHPFLAVIRDEPNAELRRVVGSDAAYIRYNFAVGDNDSYRYEPDKDRREAVAAFGDVSGTENLLRTFDAIWGRSIEIEKAALRHATLASV